MQVPIELLCGPSNYECVVEWPVLGLSQNTHTKGKSKTVGDQELSCKLMSNNIHVFVSGLVG